MLENLQPLLQENFGNSDLAQNPVYIDSTAALITALLPMVRQKVSHFLPQAGRQPELLSHFIDETLKFDKQLNEEWNYEGGFGLQAWKGLTWEVLVRMDWFPQWLQVEKDCKYILNWKSLLLRVASS